MDKNAQKWIQNNNNGQQWTKMDTNGQQWTKIDNNGQQWTTIDNNWYQWITMDNINIRGATCPSDAVLSKGYVYQTFKLHFRSTQS